MKKKQGPKTEIGKGISSQNALKHGLTSYRATTLSEREAFANYVDELYAYYQPQSPIEKLQIERIAMCKIKLDRLYALEDAQLTLAMSKFEREPEVVLDQIKAATGIVRGMVIGLIQFGKITLPSRLSATTLQAICKELEGSSRSPTKLTNAEIESQYPVLAKYLRAYYATDLSIEEELLKKLRHASEAITKTIERGDRYHETIRTIFERLMKENMPPAKQESANVDEGVTELDELIQAQQEANAKQYGNKIRKEPVLPPDTSMKRAQFEKYTQVFLQLRDALAACQQVHEHFKNTKELMAKAVTLPQSESDLLMRYQTTLERRLSTAIGELLHLQGKMGR